MRATFLGAILLGVIAGIVIVAVRNVPASGSGDAGSPGSETPAATATPDPADPGVVADAFAAAFEDQDAGAIYDLLDSDSSFERTESDVRSDYEAFFSESTATGLSVQQDAISRERATFQVTLRTAYFGDLEYSISVPFTEEEGELRIDWTPSVIHPALREGRDTRSEIRRPERGKIFDRNGTPLAQTVDRRILGLNRSIIDDRAAVTARLVEFGFSREAVDRAFDSPLAANQRVDVGAVSDDRAEEANLMVLDNPGLLLYFVSRRVHPLGPAAAHAVGYTRQLTAEELEERQGSGYRVGDRIGATGLESSLESVLAGRPGGTLEIVDRAGETVEILATAEFVEGQDVTTTLDATVLRAAHERLGGLEGAAIVIDPRDNSVLAINSSPSYDPDAFERGDAAALNSYVNDPGNPLSNRATNGVYSAGSTFKLFTGAAGLASGLYSTGDVIQCSAVWEGIEPPRRNWEGAQGPLTIAQGLMRSCNPVFYEIGLTLYNETDNYLSEVARQFGFGSRTGIVGISEQAGLVPDDAWKRENRGEPWFPGDNVNLAIGQGDLLVTPLQLANAYSTFIANELRTPVLLSTQEPEARGELPLTSEQRNHLWRGLELVTSPSGTASSAFASAGYTDFAGKSGTAEDAGQQQHVLFVAFRPSSAPEAVAAVVLDDGDSGSLEAGPIARDILLAVP